MVNGLLKHKGILRAMLALAIFMGLSPQIAPAMPVDSYGVSAATSAREAYISHIQKVLDSEVAQARLSAMGVNRDSLEQELQKLSDVQLQQLAARAEAVTSGGDSGITVVLLLIIVVLAILYFADYQLRLEPRERTDADKTDKTEKTAK